MEGVYISDYRFASVVSVANDARHSSIAKRVYIKHSFFRRILFMAWATANWKLNCFVNVINWTICIYRMRIIFLDQSFIHWWCCSDYYYYYFHCSSISIRSLVLSLAFFRLHFPHIVIYVWNVSNHCNTCSRFTHPHFEMICCSSPSKNLPWTILMNSG